MSKKTTSKEELTKAYHELFPALCLQGRIMGASDALVRDAIHDIFLELLEKKNVLNNIQNFKPYISTALRRRLAKDLKKQFTELDENKLDSQSSYENHIIQSEQKEQLRNRLQQSIESLSPSQRNILHLRFYKGLSYEEIALDLGTAKRTVYNQFHSAVKNLRQKKIF